MAEKTDQKKIVVTGGGSGGHTVTALGVLERLVEENPSLAERIVYVGSDKGMEGEKGGRSVESRMVLQKGYPFVSIRSGKLQRRFAIRTVFGLFGVVGGFIDAIRFFNGNSVAVVFSSGGYVTVPVCVVAALKKIPVVIHEQTTRVGLSNKIAGRFADKILLGFREAGDFFPHKKIKFVGNVIRKELLKREQYDPSMSAKLRAFKRRSADFPTVLIVGGGQGSHYLNSLVQQAMKSLISHFQLILLTGDNSQFQDYEKIEKCTRTLSDSQQKRIIMKKFYTAAEFGSMLDSADICVSRGGALTVYELGVKRKPSVLVPIPWVTHNEQLHNAEVLEKIGLAKIVNEGVLSPEIFFQEIQRMVSIVKGGRMRIDEERWKEAFVTDAAARIVDELEEFL